MKSIKDIWCYKFYFFVIILLIPFTALKSQNAKGVSGIEVVKTTTQEVLGVNIGFIVEFKNNYDKTVDALKYTVYYYDGFDEKMGERNFQWQSGNIIKDIEAGKSIKDYRTNWIKGANKIKVVVTKVHFGESNKNTL